MRFDELASEASGADFRFPDLIGDVVAGEAAARADFRGVEAYGLKLLDWRLRVEDGPDTGSSIGEAIIQSSSGPSSGSGEDVPRLRGGALGGMVYGMYIYRQYKVLKIERVSGGLKLKEGGSISWNSNNIARLMTLLPCTIHIPH